MKNFASYNNLALTRLRKPLKFSGSPDKISTYGKSVEGQKFVAFTFCQFSRM